MFKKSTKKTRGALCFILLTSFFALTCLIGYILSPYINSNLVLNMLPFLASAANNPPTFYGENIDMSQILPGSEHYVVNGKGQDLIDIAADLGINLIRITNAQRSFSDNMDSVYSGDQWNQVLNKMQSKGIKALILIETVSSNQDYYTPDIQPIYLDLVQKYIDSGVFSNPDVYAVDIKNEPLLTNANVSMLRAAHTMIKEKYPDLKQTVGWWATTQSPEGASNPNNYDWLDFSAGRKIASIVDFYSIHMYGLDTNHFGIGLQPDLQTKVFVSQVEYGLQTGKPILIGEFGEANGDAVSDQATIGSPELQANIYQGVYQALEEMHSSQLIGAVAFDFYSRNSHPDAWAIVKNNGDYLFPAAYILQEYATGKENASLQTTTIVHSKSYLYTNTDNGSTETISPSDRIGFKLQPNDSNNYFLSLSSNDILQPLETFYYDYGSDSYYAVYQAKSEGSTQLSISSDTNCITEIPCPDPVYTLTIIVQ
jgi:Cellulase (glycosyl hydrolase family 5)